MKAIKKSLWVFHFNSGGCNGCDLELISCFSPRYDLERFGIKMVASPKNADVLVVTGPITKKAEKMLKIIYEQMPEPKFVIAIGNCPITGGPYKKSRTVLKNLEKIIPVDIKVVGCPPKPEAIIEAFLRVMKNGDKKNSKRNEG